MGVRNQRWIGVDVGESRFSATLVNELGEAQRSWRVANTPEDREAWLEEVRSLDVEGLILESAESMSERLAQEALACGLEVFVVPATALTSFRRSEGYEDKDDDLDGLLLALMGHRGARSVRPLERCTSLEQQLRHLGRLRHRLVRRRTRLGQQLRAVLVTLSPEITTKSWEGPKVTSATFLAVFARWPDLRSLSRARQATVVRLVRRVGRYPVERAEQIASCLHRWSGHLAGIESTRLDAAAVEIRLACATLDLVREQMREVEGELEAAVAAHPAGSSLVRMPGIEWRTAAHVCGEAAALARVLSEPQLATYSGLTPASRSSGKSQRSRLRRGVHKHLASTYFVTSVASLRVSTIDRLYYDKKVRDFRGHPVEHKKATIALARQRHKVIYKILRGAEYDALRLSHSTLVRARRAA